MFGLLGLLLGLTIPVVMEIEGGNGTGSAYIHIDVTIAIKATESAWELGMP